MSSLPISARAVMARRGGAGGRWLVASTGFVAALGCWSGMIATTLVPAARSSLAVTAVAVGLWASELIPMPVTALLAMALLATTRATSRIDQALVGFSSPILFFLLGSSAIGIAADQSRLADRLAGWLMKRSGGSGRRLLGELLLSLPLQALAVPSAISRNAVLVPIYERVLGRIGRPPRLGAAVMLTLGILGPLASSALLTGGTSPVAASRAIGGFTWLSWLAALALPYYLLIAVDGLAVWLLVRPESMVRVEESIEIELPRRVSRGEWFVAMVSVLTSLLWVMDGVTHWDPAIPALLALIALMVPGVGVMSWQSFAARAPWGICLVLAGAVSLAASLTGSGAAVWLAHGLFGHLPIAHSAAPMALSVFLVTALVTLAIPNRAAAITLCIPLATAFAATGALSAAAAGLVVMIAVDAETIYPAQTAANLMAYETGYFNGGELARFNLLTLAAAAGVVVLVALPWWSFVGLPVGR